MSELSESLTMLIYGDSKSGKAVSLDTPILTYNRGWQTMESVQVSDYVYSSNGEPTRVVAVSEVMTDHDCFDVTFSEGTTITADAGHLWTVRDAQAQNSERVVTTRHLSNTHDITVHGRTATVNGKKYPITKRRWSVWTTAAISGVKPEHTPVPPWILGYWLGNGTNANGGVTSGSYKGDTDFGYVEKRVHDLGYDTTMRPHSNGSSSHTILGLQVQLRDELGVLSDKHIPDNYLYSDLHSRQELLAGLMDSDGYAGARNECEIVQMDEHFAAQILFLARSLGYKSTLTTGEATLNGKSYGTKYRVRFGATRETSPFTLPRKSAKLTLTPQTKHGIRQVTARSQTAQIVSVHPTGTTPVRCIQVEAEDGVFLVGQSLIPTHNSTLASTAPKPLLVLDVENGSKFLPGKKIAWDPNTEDPPALGDWEIAIAHVNDYETVQRAYAWLLSGKHPFRSVVVDSISELQAKALESIAGRAQLQTQQWGELLREIAGFMRDLRDLTIHPTNPLTSVVLTAMARDNQAGKKAPYLQGQAATIAPYLFDITGYLSVDTFQHPDAAQGSYTARRLRICCTDIAVCGERVGGRLPAVIEQGELDIEALINRVYNIQPPATQTSDTLTSVEK